MSWAQDKPEPEVVVPVVGSVPVAVGASAVPGVVVPAAASDHPVRASGRQPKMFYDRTSEACCIRSSGKSHKWFHMSHQNRIRPYAGLPVLLVFPELSNKSALAPSRKPDYIWKNLETQKRYTTGTSVDLGGLFQFQLKVVRKKFSRRFQNLF